MKIPITKVSRRGYIEDRHSTALQWVNTRQPISKWKKSYLNLTCDGCWKYCWRGLGDEQAVTPEELCISAKMNGWKLTSAGTYCSDCRGKLYFLGPMLFKQVAEWHARKVGMFASALCLVLELYVVAFLITSVLMFIL